MRFCKACDNMLYVQVKDAGETGRGLELAYACKSCGRTEVAGASACVIDTNYRDDQSSWRQFATPYIRHDPTLPRVSSIPCPNAKCTRPPAEEREVIYVKYDAKDLRFLYHCCHCGVFWKSTGDQAPAAASAAAAAVA